MFFLRIIYHKRSPTLQATLLGKVPINGFGSPSGQVIVPTSVTGPLPCQIMNLLRHVTGFEFRLVWWQLIIWYINNTSMPAEYPLGYTVVEAAQDWRFWHTYRSTNHWARGGKLFVTLNYFEENAELRTLRENSDVQSSDCMWSSGL
jgi:hypothetical protein